MRIVYIEILSGALKSRERKSVNKWDLMDYPWKYGKYQRETELNG